MFHMEKRSRNTLIIIIIIIIIIIMIMIVIIMLRSLQKAGNISLYVLVSCLSGHYTSCQLQALAVLSLDTLYNYAAVHNNYQLCLLPNNSLPKCII